jgi:HAD superfamily hydrolase (TIGR01450 family)
MALKATQIKALILDMDGVIWRGSQPLGNLPAIFDRIHALHLKVLLATNNSTQTNDQFLIKLHSFEVTLQEWQVINSSGASAEILKEKYPAGGPAYFLGEEGLCLAMHAVGFYHDPKAAQFVIAGMDRNLTYEKLSQASLLIRSGIPFFGTNPDRSLPTPRGLEPGAGSILAAIEAATDVHPVVFGKPQPDMYRVALNRLGTTPGETLVVGDRLETDIVGAQKLGCRSGLVLSGATNERQASQWEPAPDIIATDLERMLEMLA